MTLHDRKGYILHWGLFYSVMLAHLLLSPQQPNFSADAQAILIGLISALCWLAMLGFEGLIVWYDRCISQKIPCKAYRLLNRIVGVFNALMGGLIMAVGFLIIRDSETVTEIFFQALTVYCFIHIFVSMTRLVLLGVIAFYQTYVMLEQDKLQLRRLTFSEYHTLYFQAGFERVKTAILIIMTLICLYAIIWQSMFWVVLFFFNFMIEIACTLANGFSSVMVRLLILAYWLYHQLRVSPLRYDAKYAASLKRINIQKLQEIALRQEEQLTLIITLGHSQPKPKPTENFWLNVFTVAIGIDLLSIPDEDCDN